MLALRPNSSAAASFHAGYHATAPSQSAGQRWIDASASRPPVEPPVKYAFVGAPAA